MALASVSPVNIPPSDANAPEQMVPFRRATTRRASELVSTTATMTAASQGVEVTLEGSGFMYAIVLEVTITTAGNAAAVTFKEDAPYSAISSIVLSDVNGQSHNVTGYHMYLAMLYGGWNMHAALPTASTDTALYSATTGVGGGLGGSAKFLLPIPVGINRRDLLGILPNQDRGQKYQLRTDIAASTDVYGTAPTALGSVNIRRWYDNYSVPAGQNSQGHPQQIVPDKLGVVHFITQTLSESLPQASSTVNHYVRRVGNNVLRNIILVFRDNGSRTTAETHMPTKITYKWGDTTIFSVDTAYQRWVMREEFGFDAPAGVIVFPNITDVLNMAGGESGQDYAFSAGLVNAQFEITYPAGWNAVSTLHFIVDDILVPEGMDLFA